MQSDKFSPLVEIYEPKRCNIIIQSVYLHLKMNSNETLKKTSRQNNESKNIFLLGSLKIVLPEYAVFFHRITSFWSSFHLIHTFLTLHSDQTATISKNVPQFLLTRHVFSKSLICKCIIQGKDCSNFDKEGIVIDYLSVAGKAYQSFIIFLNTVNFV